MIRAVVFDIGRVLVDWQPEAFYDRRIGTERREALFRETAILEMNTRIDAGEPAFEVTREHAGRHPAWRDEIHAWHDDWEDTLAGPVPGTADLLMALKARGVPVLALSNFGADTILRARRLHPVLDAFDRAFISGELRLMKPDPAIYAHVEAETGLPPKTLFFTDDSPVNVAAARERGWQAHLFEDAPGLERELGRLGLL